MNSASACSYSELFDQYSLIVRSFDQLSDIVRLVRIACKITDRVFDDVDYEFSTCLTLVERAIRKPLHWLY